MSNVDSVLLKMEVVAISAAQTTVISGNLNDFQQTNIHSMLVDWGTLVGEEVAGKKQGTVTAAASDFNFRK